MNKEDADNGNQGFRRSIRDGVVAEADKIKEYYDQIISESKYLQSMVGDLLDLSKLQNSDFPIEKEPVDITAVLEDAIRSVRSIANANGYPNPCGIYSERHQYCRRLRTFETDACHCA
jgi:signal transduction histidine kinase